MRSFSIVACILLLPLPADAQHRLSAGDSALIERMLLAEDRRDSTDAALAQGLRHTDPRVHFIAQRALGRIRDPHFAARDSLGTLPVPPAWPEPAWRLRFRELTAHHDDCHALGVALADSAWPVRLHAADFVPPACASDDGVVATLRGWVEALPSDASHRARGGVSWHAAAHAAVVLARLRPELVRPHIGSMAHHAQWQVRAYAARAAAALADSATLRLLARDHDDNVKEAAIVALSKLVGHRDDEIYLEALRSGGAQAVRAAAIALKGSPRRDVHAAASAVFERWVSRANAPARDTRLALLDAAGRPRTDDQPPPIQVALPPDAVALALGADIRLRVSLTPASGGGAFTVQLRGDNAPMMAARVAALARSGYYNGLTWHRVEPDFVIQGGSPGATEYIGFPQFFRDELGQVHHVRGTVGMSTRGHDTGDAQWFVNLRDNRRLDADYTVFAEVVDGIDIVDGILEGDTIAAIEEIRPGKGRARRA